MEGRRPKNGCMRKRNSLNLFMHCRKTLHGFVSHQPEMIPCILHHFTEFGPVKNLIQAKIQCCNTIQRCDKPTILSMMVFVQYRNILSNSKQFITKARIIKCHNNASKLPFISIQCANNAKLTQFYLITKQKHIGTLYKSVSAEM